MPIPVPRWRAPARRLGKAALLLSQEYGSRTLPAGTSCLEFSGKRHLRTQNPSAWRPHSWVVSCLFKNEEAMHVSISGESDQSRGHSLVQLLYELCHLVVCFRDQDHCHWRSPQRF